MPSVKGIFGRTVPFPLSSYNNPVVQYLLSLIEQKAVVNHLHEINDVNNLQTTLDNIVAGVGGMTAYVHTQGSLSDTWTINHNKGFIPTIQTFTTGGVEIFGDVLHTSVNQTVVSFASPQQGTARII